MWTVFLIVSGVGVNTAFKSLLCGSEVWIYIWRTQWFICCFFNVCFSRDTFFYFLRRHIVLLSHGTSGNVIGCFWLEGGTGWPTCELGHWRENGGRSHWFTTLIPMWAVCTVYTEMHLERNRKLLCLCFLFFIYGPCTSFSACVWFCFLWF